MSSQLEKKVACITGAASGIGRATALKFARAGAIVVATDLDKEGLQTLATEIQQFNAEAFFLPQDVSKESSWVELIEKIKTNYKRLDILINNAGIALSGPVTQLSLEDWRRQTAVNIDGVFLGVKHSLPLMRASGGGSIVNVSSIAGIKPSAYTSCYAATKGAVRMFTKAVALECADNKDGVRVNSIHPGIVETPIWDSLIGTTEGADSVKPRAETIDQLAASSIPLGRKGELDEIVAGIFWLASDESSYVTGAELVIDGGRSIA